MVHGLRRSVKKLARAVGVRAFAIDSSTHFFLKQNFGIIWVVFSHQWCCCDAASYHT